MYIGTYDVVSTLVVLFGTRFPSRWIQQIPALSPSFPFSLTLLNIGLVSGSLSTHTTAVPQKITFLFEEQICLSRSHLFHIINSQIRLVAHRLACPYFSGLIRHPDSIVAVKTTKRGGSWPPPRPRRTPTRPQEHRHQESPLQLALSAGGDSSAASST